MKFLIVFLLAILFVSCLKEIENPELVRNNIFDPNGENIAPWFKQTGYVKNIPEPSFPSHIKHVFKYQITSQFLIDNQTDFEIVFYRHSGEMVNLSASRLTIFEQNNNYFFEASAFNFTNPNGNFCFTFALNKKDQNTWSSELSDCWQL